ncbi:MAG: hypothetical protein HOO06_06655 [Bdellovibrionaceae bacterium]|jgi:hypothetical protein|nr:hypothetical protein [Pseudobdellovibrionaceae bacterium]
MDELIVEFKQESEKLTKELIDILEDIEGDFSQKEMLDQYGQVVDRMMGGAKSLAMAVDDPAPLEMIGSYAALCKIVGYKGSQIKDNENFYNIVVGLLLDATEMLDEMVQSLDKEDKKDVKAFVSDAFLGRLQWVSEQFGEEVRSSLDLNKKNKSKTSQNEIDDLLSQLGL